MNNDNKIICGNCGSGDVSVIDEIDGDKEVILTSDARIISNARALRTLCRDCACIEVHFVPPERLSSFYENEYMISDRVQNHFIVVNNETREKHEYITSSLMGKLDSLPGKGEFLEIACGSGSLVRYFRDKNPDWKCFGIDPSFDSPGGLNEDGDGITFIRDFFSEEYFRDISFDIIVAHGFFNRSPVLPALKRIKKIVKKGTLMSLEFMVLEDSECTPCVWDHTYMYMKKTFYSYLDHAGFKVMYEKNLGPSYHIVCRYMGEKDFTGTFTAGGDDASSALQLYYGHQEWWNNSVSGFISGIKDNPDRTICLFGAGMYSAVLLNSGSDISVDYIIDEIKYGSDFHGIPVINLHEASLVKDLHVLLFSRPVYLNTMRKKLEESSIEYSTINYSSP